MLIVGYCYGIRFERRLCEEVELHLAYRWFCRLDLDDEFPITRPSRSIAMAASETATSFGWLFEAVVRACMDAGLVKGEGFAVDASVMEADASRYHGKAPNEIDWSAPERQTRAVGEFLAGLDDEDPNADRKLPKVISPTDPCSAWTAKANKRVQFGYGLNYLIDIENAVIVDVEATPARTYDEVGDQNDDRTHRTPVRSEAEAARRGHGVRDRQVPWLARRCDITPHIPVWENANRVDGTFSRRDFIFDNEKNEYRARTVRPPQPPARCTMAAQSSIGRASSIAIRAR